MNAIEVKRADTGAVVGWVCGKCGYLYDRRCGGDHEREYAAKCCACHSCGAELKTWGTECSPCMRENSARRAVEREVALYEKAEKISWRDFDDSVFTEDTTSGTCGEGWFNDAAELADHFRSEGRPVPVYCWASTPQKLCFHADSILENALDEHHEDAGESIGAAAVKELQALLDGWAERNDPGGFLVDHRRAVLLDGIGGDRG